MKALNYILGLIATFVVGYILGKSVEIYITQKEEAKKEELKKIYLRAYLTKVVAQNHKDKYK